MQISLVKRCLSGPARTFIAPLRHSKAAAWTADDVARVIEWIFKTFRPVGGTTGCTTGYKVYTHFNIATTVRSAAAGRTEHSGTSMIVVWSGQSDVSTSCHPRRREHNDADAWEKICKVQTDYKLATCTHLDMCDLRHSIIKFLEYCVYKFYLLTCS